jgi:FlaA1/EpsC-like NDP-sugar epimerase
VLHYIYVFDITIVNFILTLVVKKLLMIKLFSEKYFSRWFVLFIDLVLVAFGVYLAFLLRFNFHIPSIEQKKLVIALFTVTGIRFILFLLGKTYTGLLRYTGSKDAQHIFITLFIGSIVFIIINLISRFGFHYIHFVPYSIIGIEFLTSLFFLLSYRLLVKIAFGQLQNGNKEKLKVVIAGSDDKAIITKKTIENDPENPAKVIAFLEHNKNKKGHKIENIKIYHTSEIKKIARKSKIDQLIITGNLPFEIKQEIVDFCLVHNIEIKTVPDIKEWINGELSINQIKKYRIEDLLERDEIKLDTQKIRKDILNKTVMVTGAAGSIGSEIVRQLTQFNPKMIILYDIAETPLYNLEIELKESLKFDNFKTIIGNVLDRERLNYIISRYNPSIIYHAAALKHVPMMEINPYEAVKTNVFGTKNLVELAIEHNTEKFVFISTDKAVNPTNVMGATKRVAEILTKAYYNKYNKTKFIITRFGNVLGSNGSVIPRFREQIEKGGPITITHPEVTRYFMTIPEACRLVLEAASMGKGGEIFMFDMGKLIKILDLAKKMIKLSGLELGKDIQIVYTGLRPGEKLYEDFGKHNLNKLNQNY